MTESERIRPYVVGIAGGSCSGKTSTIDKTVNALKEKIRKNPHYRKCKLKQPRIATLDLKRFMFGNATPQLLNGHASPTDVTANSLNWQYNHQHSRPVVSDNPEHPVLLNEECLQNVLNQILSPTSTADSITLPCSPVDSLDLKFDLPLDILFVEGTLAFFNKTVRNMMDLRLFVNCDPDIRLVRQVLRDKGNQELSDILDYYANCTKPAFEEFCLPTKKYAHIVIPRNCENEVAIDLIVQHLHEILYERCLPNDPVVTQITNVYSPNRFGCRFMPSHKICLPDV